MRVAVGVDPDFRARMWALGMPADWDECLALSCIVCQRAGCKELTYYWGEWMYHGKNYEKRAPVAVGEKLHDWVRSIHEYEAGGLRPWGGGCA